MTRAETSGVRKGRSFSWTHDVPLRAPPTRVRGGSATGTAKWAGTVSWATLAASASPARRRHRCVMTPSVNQRLKLQVGAGRGDRQISTVVRAPEGHPGRDFVILCATWSGADDAVGCGRRQDRGKTVRTRSMWSRNSFMKSARNAAVDSSVTSPSSVNRPGLKVT